MVCGGLRAFHRFHRLSSQILVVVCGGLLVVCGGLWWFAVVCGGLRWFVMVCGGLSYKVIVIPTLSLSGFPTDLITNSIRWQTQPVSGMTPILVTTTKMPPYCEVKMSNRPGALLIEHACGVAAVHAQSRWPLPEFPEKENAVCLCFCFVLILEEHPPHYKWQVTPMYYNAKRACTIN